MNVLMFSYGFNSDIGSNNNTTIYKYSKLHRQQNVKNMI